MPNKVIQPGPSLVEATRALNNPREAVGTYPYQWLFPGPNSKQVLAGANQGVILRGPGFTDSIMKYTVPDGMMFSLRGVVVGFIGTGWVEGSGSLLFTLTATAAGTRKVDFLSNIPTHMGSLESPYPILGRLEFAPLTVLEWSVVNSAGPAAGPPNFCFGHLVGQTYPQSEAAR